MIERLLVGLSSLGGRTGFSFHYQDVEAELRSLEQILRAKAFQADDALDVACGDGAVTTRLSRVLRVKEVHGIELNARRSASARKRGIVVDSADVMSHRPTRKYDVVVCYGALHHFPDTLELVRALRDSSRRYVIIVDSTVRRHFFHRLTGSRYFILESSPYPIRSAAEIRAAIDRSGLELLGEATNHNANLWHDRSIFLAKTEA